MVYLTRPPSTNISSFPTKAGGRFQFPFKPTADTAHAGKLSGGGGAKRQPEMPSSDTGRQHRHFETPPCTGVVKSLKFYSNTLRPTARLIGCGRPWPAPAFSLCTSPSRLPTTLTAALPTATGGQYTTHTRSVRCRSAVPACRRVG